MYVSPVILCLAKTEDEVPVARVRTRHTAHSNFIRTEYAIPSLNTRTSDFLIMQRPNKFTS